MQGSGRMISMRNTFIIVYTVLGGLVFALACVYFIYTNFKSLLVQSENYTFSAAKESMRNIENFCGGIERTRYIVYDDPSRVAFSPADRELTQEEQQTLGTLNDLLTKANYLGDYTDLAIIYRSGHTAGILTDGTRELLGEDSFQRASEILGGADSSWTVMYYQNVSRACYLNKLNDNAVFISSFYLSDLGNVFSKMDEKSNLFLYVADRDDRIVYASDNAGAVIGDHMEFEIVNRFKGSKNVTIGDSTGAASLLTLTNGWRVYSLVYPNNSGRFGSGSTESFIIIIGLSLIIVFISAGVFISAFYTSDNRRRHLLEERLDNGTGALTAFYFEEEVSDRIETALIGGTWSFTKVAIKDLDDIAGRLGEDFIAGGLSKLIKLLRAHFGEGAVIGTNDDNEIAMFIDFSDFDIFKAHNDLKIKHEECMAVFKKLLVGDNEDYKLNVAVGVCIYPDDGNDFDELDYKAGIALSEALENEGDSIVFYSEKNRSGVSKP